MLVNSDFTQPAFLQTSTIAWEASPMAGVMRRRLDRLDLDDRQVTTIVEYAPNSEFSPHVHHGGEELLVLEGVFEDDYGDWPAGSYVRNPPGSRHKPGSRDGCLLFVKLGQFDPADQRFVHAHIDCLETIPYRDQPNRSIASLYRDQHETVRLEHWAANSSLTLAPEGGMEILVLEGTVTATATEPSSPETHTRVFEKHDWLRLPDGYLMELQTGDRHTVLWTKTGHLPLRQSLTQSLNQSLNQ